MWAIESRKGKRATTYQVVWRVAGRRFKKAFKTHALAESFRATLISGARTGEAFDTDHGLPLSELRAQRMVSWFDFACQYVDMKWRHAAAKSRAGNADALATVTPALLRTTRGRPDLALIRRALTGWAFNTARRNTERPDDVSAALRWLGANTVDMSVVAEPARVRAMLDELSLKLDGERAAAKTIGRKRAVVHNAFEYAVELKLLSANPLSAVKWTLPKASRAIDKRVVINPEQARRLLAAVGRQLPSGPRLVGFFAVMYYGALRPEEAAMLRVGDLKLPAQGWGELMLSETAPTAGAAWTDTGRRRDRRQLKQRGHGEVRVVPSPPPLTAILNEHLATHGVGADGRLFRNLTGGELAESTTGRVWDKARKAALSTIEYGSPLARRPYDLRHACVSTWLANGVPSAQCAAWAGQSVGVLHQVYAAVLADQETQARERLAAALGWH
ncbi:MAG TPA: integrase [Pseudonocardiaceae bacterium]